MDRDRLLRTFLDLVAIDSPTGHEEEIGKDLEARFGELGCAVSRDEIGNVIAVRPGTACRHDPGVDAHGHRRHRPRHRPHHR